MIVWYTNSTCFLNCPDFWYYIESASTTVICKISNEIEKELFIYLKKIGIGGMLCILKMCTPYYDIHTCTRCRKQSVCTLTIHNAVVHSYTHYYAKIDAHTLPWKSGVFLSKLKFSCLYSKEFTRLDLLSFFSSPEKVHQ